MRFTTFRPSGHIGSIAAVIAIALVVCACGATPPEPAPASPTSPTTPAATPATTPVPVPSDASGSPSPVEQVPPAALELVCPGGEMVSAAIDYAADAPGVTDIFAATRALEGVTILDQVIQPDEATTLVVRGGQAVWRGDWYNGGRGYLLGGYTACAGTTISLGG